jgi:hypothetical protein
MIKIEKKNIFKKNKKGLALGLIWSTLHNYLFAWELISMF